MYTHTYPTDFPTLWNTWRQTTQRDYSVEICFDRWLQLILIIAVGTKWLPYCTLMGTAKELLMNKYANHNTNHDCQHNCFWMSHLPASYRCGYWDSTFMTISCIPSRSAFQSWLSWFCLATPWDFKRRIQYILEWGTGRPNRVQSCGMSTWFIGQVYVVQNVRFPNIFYNHFP